MKWKMKEEDYEYLLEHWKELAKQSQDLCESLQDIIKAQQQVILKYETRQTIKPIWEKGDFSYADPEIEEN